MFESRDALIEASKPFLEPGEVVAHLVKTLEGPNRWLAMSISLVLALTITTVLGVPILGLPLFAIAYTSLYRRRLVLATDQAVVVLAGGRLRFAPRSVLERLPVDTRIGPTKGLWLRIELGEHRLYVVPRTVKEVVAADADIED